MFLLQDPLLPHAKLLGLYIIFGCKVSCGTTNPSSARKIYFKYYYSTILFPFLGNKHSGKKNSWYILDANLFNLSLAEDIFDGNDAFLRYFYQNIFSIAGAITVTHPKQALIPRSRRTS